jgi:hypothetical protein
MMRTEFPSVLFQDATISGHARIRHIRADATIRFGNWTYISQQCRGRCDTLALRLDYNLALHAFMPRAAGVATLERIRPWRLGKKLNHGGFALLQLPTFLFRGEHQAGFVPG